MSSETVGNGDIGIVPVGGLGRIGMNMLLIRGATGWHVIDCGVRFPDPEQFGANMVLPDLGWIREIAPDIRSVILTHGHEDHIGAVPHLLPLIDAPVYGTAFTLELLRRKLRDRGVGGQPALERIQPGDRIERDDLSFTFHRVTHSIPDCVAVVAHTPQGIIVHTGDWKIDPEPVDGEAFDEDGLRALGDQGVRLLMSDSTNAEVPGWTRSEASVEVGLERCIQGAPGRVIVALFSSNLHRLEILTRIAGRTGRSVCLMGTSLQRYVDAARAVGRWAPDASALIAPQHLNTCPDERALILIAGTQGESGSALRRAADGEHRHLRIQPGDRVLHSARIIPGNEHAVHAMFNQLVRQGAEVIHGRQAEIHASGHARQEELQHMLGLLRPETFVPLHGQLAFLHRHAALAREAGVEQIEVVENGQGLVLSEGGLRRGAVREVQTHFDDGVHVGTFGPLGLRDRVRLAYNGAVALHLQITSGPRGLDASVDLKTRGLYRDGGRLESRCISFLKEEIARLPIHTPRDELEEAARVLTRRFFKRESGRRPEVMVFLERSGTGQGTGDGTQ